MLDNNTVYFLNIIWTYCTCMYYVSEINEYYYYYIIAIINLYVYLCVFIGLSFGDDNKIRESVNIDCSAPLRSVSDIYIVHAMIWMKLYFNINNKKIFLGFATL